ncbi:hypothetical protein Fcan01_11294 [Folsomia candida]|uniref:Uncharacterized protein n=1 Tax=Folsomia candida TaxID=158441 RepID=A0A226EBQ8_FOLCA|nr:hypothetical protein Fcan01_11294 [Folsomia candida]
MATPGMWGLLNLFIKLYGDKLYLLPFKVSISNKQFLLVPNLSKSRRYLTIFCAICTFCHTLFCFAVLCKPFFVKDKHEDHSLPGISQTLKIVRIYGQILGALYPSAFLAMNYVLAFTPIIAQVILCSIADFQEETKELSAPKLRHPNYFFVELGMKLMLPFCFFVSIPFALTAVYLQLDPLFVLSQHTQNIILLFLLRCLILVIVAVEATKATNAFFIIGLMVVCATNDILRDLTECKVRFNLDLRFQESHLYIKLFLWNKYTNQNFCTFSVPPLIFFGFSVVVLSYYGTIRMFGKASFLVYLIIPSLGILSTLFVIMLIPHGTRVLELSEIFILSRINATEVSKFERKMWKSRRPLGTQVDSFGHAGKSLKILAFKYIAESTINLLLTF